MGYSMNDGVVRADRFKPSGKWYDSIALDMSRHYNAVLIHNAVLNAMEDQGVKLEPGWSIVVLEPYHKHSHPVMLKGELR